MKDNYNKALAAVLKEEGGWANHPQDPGGATMYGVTQRVYDAYRKRVNKSAQSVRYIEKEELQAIYRQQYADPIRFDQLPSGVDLFVFDGAVNSGPSQSVKWLQRALDVTADGRIGNVTMAALEAEPDYDRLVERMSEQRMAFLRRLKTWPTFGKGWTKRVDRITSLAYSWADGEVDVEPVRITDARPMAKAMVTDVAMPPAPTGTPTVGAGIGGVGVMVAAVRDELTPYAGAGYAFVDKLLLGLVVLSAVAAFGTFAYGAWASRKRKSIAKDIDLDTDAEPT